MSNIKNFETPADYESFKGGDEMVKPNVSYVKETNEVHYNPRFAFYFEPGNYYVEEANYLNEVRETLYNDYPVQDKTYRITIYGDVYDYSRNYLGNIIDYTFFNYLKKIIIMDGNPNGNIGTFIYISYNGLQTYNSKLYFDNNDLEYWGYCNYLDE